MRYYITIIMLLISFNLYSIVFEVSEPNVYNHLKEFDFSDLSPEQKGRSYTSFYSFIAIFYKYLSFHSDFVNNIASQDPDIKKDFADNATFLNIIKMYIVLYLYKSNGISKEEARNHLLQIEYELPEDFATMFNNIMSILIEIYEYHTN